MRNKRDKKRKEKKMQTGMYDFYHIVSTYKKKR